MTWWAWLVLGAFLFGAELFAIDAQFYLIFLGVSAAIVGLLGSAGIVMPEWGQWLTFAVLSLLSMVMFRKSIYAKIRGDVAGFKEGLAGEYVVVKHDLAPGEQSRASFRGSDWTVLNAGDVGIAAGERAIILRSESLTLYISVEAD